MAVLVIGCTTGITEDYPVVRRVGLSMASLALGGEQRLSRLSPFDTLSWLWNDRYECNGLVHTAPRFGSRRKWSVRIRDVRVVVVVLHHVSLWSPRLSHKLTWLSSSLSERLRLPPLPPRPPRPRPRPLADARPDEAAVGDVPTSVFKPLGVLTLPPLPLRPVATAGEGVGSLSLVT